MRKIYKNILIINRFLKRKYWTFLVKQTCKSYKSVRVNGKSIVNKNSILGENVNFNGMHIKGKGRIVIGDNFHSGFECVIISDLHNYDNGIKIPYDHTYISKDILIEDNVWLGDRVMILGGVKIEEGAIIQAGSVVVSNIPKYAIAGGHPAKVFKYRNIEHYERLRKELQFH